MPLKLDCCACMLHYIHWLGPKALMRGTAASLATVQSAGQTPNLVVRIRWLLVQVATCCRFDDRCCHHLWVSLSSSKDVSGAELVNSW